MTRPRRDADGYAPLRSYAGIGDGRSVALIALDGSVDWWAVPGMDGILACAALLDPEHGGRFLLAPLDDYEAEREHVGDTNVVSTTYTTAGGTVRVTDAMNTGVAGRLPWAELARRVEGLSGRVRMGWRFEPGTSLGTLSPWSEVRSGDVLVHLDDLVLGLRCGDVGEPEAGDRLVQGGFETSEGSRHLLAVVGTQGEPTHLPDPRAVDERIDRTVRGWQDWSRSVHWDGPWPDAVQRSLLALKLLVSAPTGAIAAAATLGLPERVGGDKNYDYRYTWVRDAAYTLDAFLRCGLAEEVHAAVAWLLATVERHRPELRPFYTLAGEPPGGSAVRDVPGYRRSTPVKQGNDARTQLQLGPYGDLFQTVFLCVDDGHVLDVGTARLLADLADRCCDLWQRPDAGMWELHEEQHFTLSKMSCWQALDRAARLAERGELAGSGERWRREADRVRAWVDEHCWSEERGAYVMAAGSDELDAGILLGARFGFDRGPRMRSTVDAVLAELGSGPWVHRYTSASDEEGAFLACTFWVVEALALTGDVPRARALMDRTLGELDGTWLLAEMVDPRTGDYLGNLPQALSHLALINAASAVREAEEGR
ncbi:glycoside hydrolase family 15 protein [Motilibacter rhizosphaerae]|uniref:glycoside hydrolase family 15 protein n=1 Tax=Motilibacter rhizosphaerae TaxID=598652 RepID=UPI00102AAB84|nr:glycoside hydrolase family 15 protein [Motilibacter rhizosphaerae]